MDEIKRTRPPETKNGPSVGMVSTNARHAMRLESASRERVARENAETTERERIRQLNERFKNL